MNNYKQHQKLVAEFSQKVSQEIPALRIFPRHVGQFFIKRIVKNIIDYLPIQVNRPGMADAYALISTNFGLIHIEIEFKTGSGIQTKDQKNWQSFINSMGGAYFVVRDTDKGIEDIIKYMNSRGFKHGNPFR